MKPPNESKWAMKTCVGMIHSIVDSFGEWRNLYQRWSLSMCEPKALNWVGAGNWLVPCLHAFGLALRLGYVSIGRYESTTLVRVINERRVCPKYPMFYNDGWVWNQLGVCITHGSLEGFTHMHHVPHDWIKREKKKIDKITEMKAKEFPVLSIKWPQWIALKHWAGDVTIISDWLSIVNGSSADEISLKWFEMVLLWNFMSTIGPC